MADIIRVVGHSQDSSDINMGKTLVWCCAAQCGSHAGVLQDFINTVSMYIPFSGTSYLLVHIVDIKLVMVHLMMPLVLAILRSLNSYCWLDIFGWTTLSPDATLTLLHDLLCAAHTVTTMSLLLLC